MSSLHQSTEQVCQLMCINEWSEGMIQCVCIHSLWFTVFHIGVTFGFGPVQYRVNEGAGSVTLFVALLEGTLEREVNLQFSTIEGTATASGIVKINLVHIASAVVWIVFKIAPVSIVVNHP